MAYGRQRRVAAILKKKREEEAKKQGLNALSADSLTRIVSDDANDLDQVQFTTTNGAKVNIQNQRGKTEEGQTVTPTIKTLGQSFSGGSLQDNLPQIDSLGQSYTGGSLQNNLPEPELELPQAVADFTGQPVGKSFSGGPLQNAPLDLGQGTNIGGIDFGLTGEQLANRNIQKGRDAETMRSENAMGYDEQSMRNELYADELNLQAFGNDPLPRRTRGDMTAERNQATEERDIANLTNELVDAGQLPETSRINRSMPAVNTGRGSQANIDLNAQVNEGRIIAEEEALTQRGIDAGLLAAPTSTDQFGNIVVDADEQLMREDIEADALNEAAFAEEAGDPLRDRAIAEGAMNTDGTIDEDWMEAQEPGITGRVAEQGLNPVVEAQEADNDIIAATAGNPESAAVVKDVKAKVEDVKGAVEAGTMSVEDAKSFISSSISDLGELLGIDGKDLIKGLIRYAGARIFGSSSNSAAKFAYEGWVGDSSGASLGANATSQQKNLHAYKQEASSIDAQIQAGTIDAAEGARQKGFARDALGLSGKAVAPKYFEASFKHAKSGKIYTKRVGPNGVEFVGADQSILPASETPHLRETAKERELSPATEKALTASQANYTEARETQQKTTALLTGFNEYGDEMFSGFLGETSEGIKGFFGQEDELTHLRKGWRELTVMQGINSLPPGVASDKDIELAFSSVPKENANPEFVKAWLVSKQSAANYMAKYSQFEMQFLEENRGRRSGLDKAWKDTPEFEGLQKAIFDPLKGWGKDRQQREAIANLPSSITGKVQQQTVQTTQDDDLIGKYL